MSQLKSAESYMELKAYIKDLDELRSRLINEVGFASECANYFSPVREPDVNNINDLNRCLAYSESRFGRGKKLADYESLRSFAGAVKGGAKIDNYKDMPTPFDVDKSFYNFSKGLQSAVDASRGKATRPPKGLDVTNIKIDDAKVKVDENKKKWDKAVVDKKNAKRARNRAIRRFLFALIPCLVGTAGTFVLGAVGISILGTGALGFSLSALVAAVLPAFVMYYVTRYVLFRRILDKRAEAVGIARDTYRNAKEAEDAARLGYSQSYEQYLVLCRYAASVTRGYKYEPESLDRILSGEQQKQEAPSEASIVAHNAPSQGEAYLQPNWAEPRKQNNEENFERALEHNQRNEEPESAHAEESIFDVLESNANHEESTHDSADVENNSETRASELGGSNRRQINVVEEENIVDQEPEIVLGENAVSKENGSGVQNEQNALEQVEEVGEPEPVVDNNNIETQTIDNNNETAENEIHIASLTNEHSDAEPEREPELVTKENEEVDLQSDNKTRDREFINFHGLLNQQNVAPEPIVVEHIEQNDNENANDEKVNNVSKEIINNEVELPANDEVKPTKETPRKNKRSFNLGALVNKPVIENYQENGPTQNQESVPDLPHSPRKFIEFTKPASILKNNDNKEQSNQAELNGNKKLGENNKPTERILLSDLHRLSPVKAPKTATKTAQQRNEELRNAAINRLNQKSKGFSGDEMWETINYALQDDYRGNFDEIPPADFAKLEESVTDLFENGYDDGENQFDSVNEIKKRGVANLSEKEFVLNAEYQKAALDYYGRFVAKTYADGERVKKPIDPTICYAEVENLSYDDLKAKKSILVYRQNAYKKLSAIAQNEIEKNPDNDEAVVTLEAFEDQAGLAKARIAQVEVELVHRDGQIFNRVSGEIEQALIKKNGDISFNAKDLKIASETGIELYQDIMKELGKKKNFNNAQLKSQRETLAKQNSEIAAYQIFKSIHYATKDDLAYALVMENSDPLTLSYLEEMFKGIDGSNTPKASLVHKQAERAERLAEYSKLLANGEAVPRDLEIQVKQDAKDEMGIVIGFTETKLAQKLQKLDKTSSNNIAKKDLDKLEDARKVISEMKVRAEWSDEQLNANQTTELGILEQLRIASNEVTKAVNSIGRIPVQTQAQKEKEILNNVVLPNERALKNFNNPDLPDDFAR